MDWNSQSKLLGCQFYPNWPIDAKQFQSKFHMIYKKYWVDFGVKCKKQKVLSNVKDKISEYF